MSRPGAHIAWFLALSTLLHAAVLSVGNRFEIRSIGPAEPTLQLSMAYRAPTAVPSSPIAAPDDVPAHRARAHANQQRPTHASVASKASRRPSALPPRETAAATTTPAVEAPDAAVPAASSAGTGGSPENAEEHLRASILRLLSSRFHYPLLARRKGMQGIVRLQVRIESDGRISRLQVQQTSGYPVLDQAALQSLQLASVPDAPQWMNGQAIDIIIPVEYRLVGG